jgi:hypothetical protein
VTTRTGAELAGANPPHEALFKPDAWCAWPLNGEGYHHARVDDERALGMTAREEDDPQTCPFPIVPSRSTQIVQGRGRCLLSGQKAVCMSLGYDMDCQTGHSSE